MCWYVKQCRLFGRGRRRRHAIKAAICHRRRSFTGPHVLSYPGAFPVAPSLCFQALQPRARIPAAPTSSVRALRKHVYIFPTACHLPAGLSSSLVPVEADPGRFPHSCQLKGPRSSSKARHRHGPLIAVVILPSLPIDAIP